MYSLRIIEITVYCYTIVIVTSDSGVSLMRTKLNKRDLHEAKELDFLLVNLR